MTIRREVLDVLESARKVAASWKLDAPVSGPLEELLERVEKLNGRRYPEEPELEVAAAMKEARLQVLREIEEWISDKESAQRLHFRIRTLKLRPPELSGISRSCR